ncbi:hypothetical protein OQ968_24810, partial [Mycobacterium sp. 663a-19]|uniref:hypothetical protein n=1 Tax=Mycobacterium sp. 663a-19 TaxID=2986148 RepID=UPI002D1F5957
YQNYPIDTAALTGADGLAITEITSHDPSRYPLTVQAVSGAESGIRVKFDTAVFDTATVEALVARLERVLVAMSADPARPVSSIDVLDAGEHVCLDEIGHRAVLGAPGPAPVSIPVLWAAQVGRSPDAVALVCGGG